ncbi:MAG: hypothetical protein LBK58_15120, partial [Prevotellaceae bacterium]|nr:hypothetical protein [Prevotellaceae bacterium]
YLPHFFTLFFILLIPNSGYTMVKTQSEYDEKLIQTNEPEFLRKKLKSVKKYVEKIEEQIKIHENLANIQLT